MLSDEGCDWVQPAPSFVLTEALALAKSMRPAYFAFSAPTTLPMSLIETAPVSAMAAAIAASTAA